MKAGKKKSGYGLLLRIIGVVVVSTNIQGGGNYLYLVITGWYIL